MGDQLLAAGVVGGDDERGHDLPPLPVLASGDRDLGHAGMGEQRRLDPMRADVLAAADDQVVAAALDPDQFSDGAQGTLLDPSRKGGQVVGRGRRPPQQS